MTIHTEGRDLPALCMYCHSKMCHPKFVSVKQVWLLYSYNAAFTYYGLYKVYTIHVSHIMVSIKFTLYTFHILWSL